MYLKKIALSQFDMFQKEKISPPCPAVEMTILVAYDKKNTF